MTGNGPVLFDGNTTHLIENPQSWTKLGHVLYVDQPAGTGFSSASNPYPVRDNDRVTSDFYKWLQSFFSHFPHLRAKRVHMIGESYAGIYIPYFAYAIAENQDDYPIDLRSISLGDGTMGNPAAMTAVTVSTFLESKKSLLQIPDEILSAFTQADQTCGFTTVLQQAEQFPPKGKFEIAGDPENLNYKHRHRRHQFQQYQRRNLRNVMNETCNNHPTTPEQVSSSILNSTCYGSCATFSTAMNYLNAVSAAGTGKRCFDIYDITNDCTTIDPLGLMASYFSRGDVQAALNLPPAPAGLAFAPCNSTILDTLLLVVPPTPPAYTILPSLVTEHNISVHVYSGDNDLLLNHVGTELVLQNMTWRGAQGFSRKPSRTFYADDAAPALLGSDACDVNVSHASTVRSEIGQRCVPAGIWASERGVTYHLFRGAGHSVFIKKPREMFAYVRDVVVADANG
jgi:carboxypeptidase C (cathepsin A)